LVNEPPFQEKPGAHEGEKLVTIATFPTVMEASVARGALEAEGVASFVPTENIGVFGPSRQYPEGAWPELKVRASDRDRAIEALRRAGHQ
jgi:hypothetical protein